MLFTEGDAEATGPLPTTVMTTCPRCGANNEANRAACWDCYAPLTGAIAAKVKPLLLAGHGGVTVEPTQESAGAAPAKKKGLFGKK